MHRNEFWLVKINGFDSLQKIKVRKITDSIVKYDLYSAYGVEKNKLNWRDSIEFVEQCEEF